MELDDLTDTMGDTIPNVNRSNLYRTLKAFDIKRNLKYLRFHQMCFKILLLRWYNIVKLDKLYHSLGDTSLSNSLADMVSFYSTGQWSISDDGDRHHEREVIS